MAMEVTQILSSASFDFANAAKLSERDHRAAFEIALAHVLREVAKLAPDFNCISILRRSKSTSGSYKDLVWQVNATQNTVDSMLWTLAGVIYDSSEQDFLMEITGTLCC